MVLLVSMDSHHHHHHHHQHQQHSHHTAEITTSTVATATATSKRKPSSHRHRRCHTDTSILDYFCLDSSIEELPEETTRESLHPQQADEDPEHPQEPLSKKIRRTQSACSLQSFLKMGFSTASEVGTLPKEALEQHVASSSPLDQLEEPVQEEEDEKKDLLPFMLEAVEAKEWNRVLALLEQDPSLARREVSMVCQGENSKCLLVHLLSTGPKEAPLSVMDSLVTLHPASLLQTDKRGSRLPLHLAVLTGSSEAVVHYLCRARPQALKRADQEGNLPLHYAAMYGSEATLRLFVESYSSGCRITNGRDRLPLHLLCARCFEESSLSGGLQVLLEAYPKGLEACDRFGRTPLHLAAQVRHMQWDFMEKLVDTYPDALLLKDKSRQIPLQLARRASCGGSSLQRDILLSALEEVTIRERRKAHPYRPFVGLMLSPPRPHRKRSTTDLYHCYG